MEIPDQQGDIERFHQFVSKDTDFFYSPIIDKKEVFRKNTIYINKIMFLGDTCMRPAELIADNCYFILILETESKNFRGLYREK